LPPPSVHARRQLLRIDRRFLAAPVMLHDEAFGAAFCGYHRSTPGRLREGRELERAADLGPLVRRRHSDLVAVDLLSRLVAGADAAAVADALALAGYGRGRLALCRAACGRQPTRL